MTWKITQTGWKKNKENSGYFNTVAGIDYCICIVSEKFKCDNEYVYAWSVREDGNRVAFGRRSTLAAAKKMALQCAIDIVGNSF